MSNYIQDLENKVEMQQAEIQELEEKYHAALRHLGNMADSVQFLSSKLSTIDEEYKSVMHWCTCTTCRSN